MGGAKAQTTLAPGAGVINTVAGNGTACSNYTTTGCGNGGRATSAELKNAFGVAVDNHFNLYIADTGDNVVREVLASTGDIETVAGNGTVCANPASTCGDGGSATSAQLNAPHGVAVDSSGNIYIADTGDNKIRKVAAGTITTIAGNGSACTSTPCGDGSAATSAQLDSPAFLALDSSGDIYVTDTEYEVVREVKSGIISKVAGIYGESGNCSVNCGNGGSATLATFDQPEGLAVDVDGNLYIADLANNQIREVSGGTPSGTINDVAGASNGTVCPVSTESCGDGGPATSAELHNPWGVTVDASSNIYIADTGDQRIRVVINSTGLISTLAGDGTAGFTDDTMAAINAEIQTPQGIAVDTLGNIYFTDEIDSRIRAVGPNTFTLTTGSMDVARMYNTATLLQNGLVLITGGCSTCVGNATAFASAELYNPATGTFALTGSMNVARFLHTATLLPSGLVLIAGGLTTGGGWSGVPSAELYNPATGTFTLTGSITGSMNVARQHFTATLLQNGMVLAAGGYGGMYGITSAELYNPATGTFALTGSMNDPHYGHTATLLPSGLVLIVGSFAGYTSAAELYDPATGAFTLTGSMNTGRRGETATLVPGGLVLVTGGADDSSSAELYSPAAGTFTLTGSMNAERENLTATLLPSGLVLVAGGAGGGAANFLASAELYDPVTGAFTWTGSMTVARAYQTATLLPSGLVLIAGGEDSGGILASAEIY